jgi:hypothetical protein
MTLGAGTKLGTYEILAPLSYRRVLGDLYLATGLK